MISRQEKLFGNYNKETRKADILPCTQCSQETFEADAKSAEMRAIAQEVIEVANQECAATDPSERKRLHDKKQKVKKQKCPVYCFQGFPADAHRVNAQMVLNGLYMADFDDVGDVEQTYREWMDMWPQIDPAKPPLSAMAEALGLLYIGDSITRKGIRIVGKCDIAIGTPFDNALWLGRQLMLEPTQDEQCKDLCRASYAVPWEHIRYISDELFTYENPAYDAKYNKRTKSTESTVTTESSKSVETAEPQEQKLSKPAAKHDYLGIPMQTYIDFYWQKFNHGQTPAEGARDTLTFELACDLRHICNFSREVLLDVIPSYDGFPESQRQKVIDSALSRERGPMPYRMREVLKSVRQQYENDPEIAIKFEEAEEDTRQQQAQAFAKALPFGFKDAMQHQPLNMVMPIATSLFPNIGAQATGVRLDVHNEGFRNLNLQAYIAGKAASNKGIITEIFKLFTRRMKAHDDRQRELEAEQAAMMKKAKNKTEQPEERHFPQYLQSLRTSMTEVLYRLQHAEGRHLLSHTSESDQLAAGQGQMWSNMSVILRKAYDGDSFEQDYRSDTSTRAWIDHVLWNVILCGTPDALYRMYRNYTDGTITRNIIARTPDNTYAPLTIRKKRSEKAEDNIDKLTILLPLMKGDITLPRLERTCQEWLERVRLETIKSDDSTRANLRFRIAISTMRCVATMMLCDFAGWLIREIDQATDKPEWADGCNTAADYLSKHPEATAYWLPRKFQRPVILSTFSLLADYYLENALYFFRQRIEDAVEHNLPVSGLRVIRGKNDDVFNHLNHRFTLKEAQAARHDKDYSRTRSMVKNWCKAGLAKNVDTGVYEKTSK